MNFLQRQIASQDDGYAVSDATRLNDAFSELVGLFRMTNLTAEDRDSQRYLDVMSITKKVQKWDNPPEWALETDHLILTYFRQSAADALRDTVLSGRLKIWTADRSGERERDTAAIFSGRHYFWLDTLERGLYVPSALPSEPVPDYIYARLWLKLANWEDIRGSLVEDRLRRFNTQFPEGLGSILRRLPNPPAVEIAPDQWSDERMTIEILNCGYTDRDTAWKHYFKEKQHIHNWKNQNFRDFWPIARSTENMRGRPPKKRV